MILLKLKNISKSFSNRKILNNFNLTIKEREIITIFGPNGCGKTTLLNIISKIIIQDKGEVIFNKGKNKIGYVFQNYRDSLLPWKNNLDNIAFTLELEGIDVNKRRLFVKNRLNSLNLNIPLYSFPYQSSGGEQQLVSILREVLTKPSILLMDEPFSALNIENKSYLKIKLLEIKKKLGLTIILVTHDLSEAIQLGDRLVLINKKGKIKRIFPITFKKPRSEDILYTKKFITFKKRIISYFSEMKK